MMYLLDTHTLLWYLNDDQQLPLYAKKSIEDTANDILISIASLWEIEIKASLGKLVLRASVEKIHAVATQQGMRILPISVEHLIQLRGLPFHHRDPFDRLLIAQAITEKADIISGDQFFPLYPVRIVWEKRDNNGA